MTMTSEGLKPEVPDDHQQAAGKPKVVTRLSDALKGLTPVMLRCKPTMSTRHRIEEIDLNPFKGLDRAKPACFGWFYSYGAIDCEVACEYTEECKALKPKRDKDLPPPL